MPKPHPRSVGISTSAALRTFKSSCKGAHKVLPAAAEGCAGQAHKSRVPEHSPRVRC